MKTLITLALLLSNSAHAHLIEDGAAFTGKFRILDSACFLGGGTFYGEPQPVITEIDVKGTPEGLNFEGNLIQLGDAVTIQHGEGISVTSGYAEYLSPFKFTTSLSITDSGETVSSTDQFTVTESGLLVHSVHSVSSKTGVTDSACHFQRI
jgi:hypothetical protein